jgi:hypothetical protein
MSEWLIAFVQHTHKHRHTQTRTHTNTRTFPLLRALRPLSKALAERCMLVVKRTGGGGVAFAPLALEDPAAQADHNGTVLGLLSAGMCVCVCVCVCMHVCVRACACLYV